MEATPLLFDALQMVREWCLWLVGITVAVLGGLFSLLTVLQRSLSKETFQLVFRNKMTPVPAGQILLGGILCLALSVGWACILLAGLPELVFRLPETLPPSLYELPIAFPFPGPLSLHIPLWIPMLWQNGTFALGFFLILLFLAGCFQSTPESEAS